MNHPPSPKKRLRLTIEVDEFNADDLNDLVEEFDTNEDPAYTRLYIVTEEWVRPEVTLTLCTIPGDKCTRDDFEMVPFTGRIVAAEAVDRD